MRCFSCKGPFHPSTGHYHRQWDVSVCGTCTRAFVAWLRGHVHFFCNGAKFYDHAWTSVIAGGRRGATSEASPVEPPSD